MNTNNACATEQCTVEKCDIFDVMARHVGMTVIHPGGFAATRRLAEACHLDSKTKVVDIACGKGTSAVYLAERYGCQVVGLDLCEDLVGHATRLARRKGLEGKVTFHVGDALHMPFPDNEFDVAISQAMLVLVDDQRKAIQEAIRVTRPGGYLGWLELSWRAEPTDQFMKEVSTVICAYCMSNAHTYEGWQSLLSGLGVRDLNTIAASMDFRGMRGMVADEGLVNTARVALKYVTNRRVRTRMRTMDRFFKDHASYFGYGIYVGRK